MTRRKLFLLIPLLIAGGLLIYCWTIILTTDLLATWRHHLGLELFVVLAYCYFKNYKIAMVGGGIYFLLATFNLLSMTAAITTSWFRIGPIQTPPVQLLSFGLLILFVILNLDPLIDIYLDHKENRPAKVK